MEENKCKQLPFENWIFRNGQQVRDDDIIEMNSTWEQPNLVLISFASLVELFHEDQNHIGGIMVIVFASSAVYGVFESR